MTRDSRNRPATLPKVTSDEMTSKRKPRLMVAGEFSAGKTQLINGLLGDQVLPSNVTATALPPVWLTSGRNACMAVDLDGKSRSIQSLDEVSVEDTHYCIISHPAKLLEQFDIIDTPGNSDPNIPSESWERMLDYADAVIWCTNATQAWRQSEKAVWNEMPERLLAHSTLLVTHADRIIDERSVDRVMRRVRREAGEFFDSFLMASLLKADDLVLINDALSLTLKSIDPLRGAANDIVQDFALSNDPNEVPKAVVAKITPRRVKKGKVAVQEPEERIPEVDQIDHDIVSEDDVSIDIETLQIDLFEDLSEDTVTQDTPEEEVVVSDLEGLDDTPPEEMLEDDILKSLLSNINDSDAPTTPEPAYEVDHSAKIHLLIPPVESMNDAVEVDYTPRAQWKNLSQDIDFSNPSEILDCVERLITRLEDQGNSLENQDDDKNQSRGLATNFVKRKAP